MLSDPKPELLRILKSDELLPAIGLWTWLGGFAMISGCSLLVLLTATTRYNQTVRASAVIRPSGETRLVQAAEEGRIRSIEVVENQAVKQGDVIAYLEDSRLQTQRNQLQEKIWQGQQQLTEVDRQIQSFNAQIVAESSYLERTINATEADLSRNLRDYQDRQVVTQTELQEAEANLKLAKDERDRYQMAVEAGIVSRLQYGEKEQAVAIAEARLQRAKATVNPNDANVITATERIAQERAKGESMLANLRREQQALQQRRIELLSQISQDQKDLRQTEIDLKKTVLRAPIAGKILKLELRNPDQVVRPGETVAQISPDQNALVVKAFVPAEDIAKVASGQLAHLRVSAYPYPDYGVLEGRVQAISSDSLSPPTNKGSSDIPSLKNMDSGNRVYEITIQPKNPYFMGKKHELPKNRDAIRAGMEGTVDIVTKEDTILKFILRKVRILTDL